MSFAAFGRNIPDRIIHDLDVTAILEDLDERLERGGHDWQAVKLLIIANSKRLENHELQKISDDNLVNGLRRFCVTKDWSPSMIGTTVYSSFWSDKFGGDLNIDDGILVIAVLSPLLDRIAVVHETSADDQARKLAGVHVLDTCAHKLRDAVNETYGTDYDRLRVLGPALGIMFTSGSGHVEARELIDFTECFAIGQEVLGKFSDVRIVGGCSTNRSADQLQCLYYSDTEAEATMYRFTYNHSAVAAFLPYAWPSLVLEHPYVVVDDKPLQLRFSEVGAFAPGRNFYVSSINGQSPIEFLAQFWDLSEGVLNDMLDLHTSIPTEHTTFSYTIASSDDADDAAGTWPNVPVWFERVNGEPLLRLVRAEPQDNNYYLMVMAPKHRAAEYSAETRRELALEAFQLNCVNLARRYLAEAPDGGATLSFLCESRKVLLEEFGSNIEVESIVSTLPRSATKIGIYLNGEYSYGARGSIGYHNFSQISAVVPACGLAALPFPAGSADLERTTRP